jgi:hypothetical protein
MPEHARTSQNTQHRIEKPRTPQNTPITRQNTQHIIEQPRTPKNTFIHTLRTRQNTPEHARALNIPLNSPESLITPPAHQSTPEHSTYHRTAQNSPELPRTTPENARTRQNTQHIIEQPRIPP